MEWFRGVPLCRAPDGRGLRLLTLLMAFRDGELRTGLGCDGECGVVVAGRGALPDVDPKEEREIHGARHVAPSDQTGADRRNRVLSQRGENVRQPWKAGLLVHVASFR